MESGYSSQLLTTLRRIFEQGTGFATSCVNLAGFSVLCGPFFMPTRFSTRFRVCSMFLWLPCSAHVSSGLHFLLEVQSDTYHILIAFWGIGHDISHRRWAITCMYYVSLLHIPYCGVEALLHDRNPTHGLMQHIIGVELQAATILADRPFCLLSSPRLPMLCLCVFLYLFLFSLLCCSLLSGG